MRGTQTFGGGLSVRDAFYFPGDALTATTYFECFGYITSAGKEAVINAISPKLVTHINGLSVTSLEIALRTVDGGYIGGANWYNPLADSTVTTNITISGGLIKVGLIKTESWGCTNNTPIIGRIRLKGTFN